MYAILSHGGRQYRVSAGDRLVVDRLDAEVGSVVALEPVLLTGGDGTTALGDDVDGIRVAVTVIAHRRGEKLRIFKYKAKKRSRKVAGYRSDLTELRVDSILAKGAEPPAPGAAGARRPARAPAAVPDAATSETAAGADATPAPTSAARPAKRATAARTPRSAPTATGSQSKAATTAAPEESATTTAKPARKRAAKGGKTAAEETGDGA